MNRPIKPNEKDYFCKVELDNGQSVTITSPYYRVLKDAYYYDLEKYCDELEGRHLYSDLSEIIFAIKKKINDYKDDTMCSLMESATNEQICVELNTILTQLTALCNHTGKELND